MLLGSRVKEQLVTALEVPRDLAYQETIVSVTGTNRILIENYKSIVKLSDTEIVIGCIHGKIYFHGNRMKVLRYTPDEMLLTGVITEILLKR